MRKKEVKCVKCKEQVTRRQSLAVGPDQRACRKHSGTRDAALVYCVDRCLARAAK